MRGLVTTKVHPGAFSGQRQGWKTPQEDPVALHCFCVCTGRALLGDLLGVSRYVECDFLSACRFILEFSWVHLFVSSLIRDVLLCLSNILYVHFLFFLVWLHSPTIPRFLHSCSPFPFGRICFVALIMRKGREGSWSGPWHLDCTLEVFHVHSYQDQFIQPSWAECFFLCI